MKALVVDDSRAMRRIVSNTLAKLGIECVQAGHGEEALQVLAVQDFDLVTIDWNMPVMNGLELVKRIRAKDDLKELFLVMVTSETDIDRVMDALAEGANEYVMKPFTAEILKEKLEIAGISLPGPVG